jgi:cytochrome c-type biogenesis protein
VGLNWARERSAPPYCREAEHLPWLFQLYDQLASATHVAPWVYGLVLAGGVASAISPCYVPILALFGSHIGGYAHGKKSAGFALALPFIVGNALTLAGVG